MKVHCLQHTSFETPGAILKWAAQHNADFSITQSYRDEALPDIYEIDFLIVLGGPQSATQLEKYPYLKAEVKLIQQAIFKQKVVVGICLGAQLIGEALGAATEKSPYPEIGIFPLDLLPEAKHDPIFSQFPKKLISAHWHNDMPGLAKGMMLLASSQGCPRQAFCYGDRVYGLQCHFEMMKSNVEKMLTHCKEDLRAGLYIQDPQTFLNADFDTINQKMSVILDYLTSKIS
jgi:GMP synthase (glutamine-hydrolysing)